MYGFKHELKSPHFELTRRRFPLVLLLSFALRAVQCAAQQRGSSQVTWLCALLKRRAFLLRVWCILFIFYLHFLLHFSHLAFSRAVCFSSITTYTKRKTEKERQMKSYRRLRFEYVYPLGENLNLNLEFKSHHHTNTYIKLMNRGAQISKTQNPPPLRSMSLCLIGRSGTFRYELPFPPSMSLMTSLLRSTTGL